jgi:putative oxidoreductase
MNFKRLLTIAGLLSIGVAAFHVVLSFSANLSQYFGATPDIVQMLRHHDPLVYVLMLFMIAVFTLFGLYGLSGGGRFRRLPLLRTGLWSISAIYTLRGLALFPEVLGKLGLIEYQVPPQEVVSSLVSLIIGLFYMIGTIPLLRIRRAKTEVGE